MAQQLMVKCKGCYTPFTVPEQRSREEFQAASIPTTSIQCPHCRIKRPYDKGDYFFGSG
jgi:RNase P subunit RPR2